MLFNSFSKHCFIGSVYDRRRTRGQIPHPCRACDAELRGGLAHHPAGPLAERIAHRQVADADKLVTRAVKERQVTLGGPGRGGGGSYH